MHSVVNSYKRWFPSRNQTTNCLSNYSTACQREPSVGWFQQGFQVLLQESNIGLYQLVFTGVSKAGRFNSKNIIVTL